MNLVVLLLCSGFFHFAAAANRFRRFMPDKQFEGDLNKMLKKCEEQNMSLVTLYDEEDAKSLLTSVSQRGGFWLGLRKIRENVSTWSNGKPYTFKISNVALKPGEQRCGAVENDAYTDFGCNKNLHFMCNKGNTYHLIENFKKDWCQAQRYCRRHFDDLVSINDVNQKQQVVMEGKGKTFWIGLLHDEWEWQDKSCSTYRSWKSKPSGNCTALVPSPRELNGRSCSIKGVKLCSKGNVRIVVIREELNWENALNYCLANHSRLLQIEDVNDKEDVHTILSSSIDGTFWIGLRQSRVFGFWIWSDKGTIYSNWENNHTPEMPLSGNCGVINAKTSEWRDENCLHLHPFLCEDIY